MEMKNELQLVTYEQAQILKKLCFDWTSMYYYNNYGDLMRNYGLANHNSNKLNSFINSFSAPSAALALKWCRDEKGLVSSVNQVQMLGKSSSKYTFSHNNQYGCYFGENTYDTYEHAESALLDNILTFLEKQ